MYWTHFNLLCFHVQQFPNLLTFYKQQIPGEAGGLPADCQKAWLKDAVETQRKQW